MAKTENKEYKYWINEIKKGAEIIKSAPFKLKLQKDFALACCNIKGMSLEYFVDFQDDTEVVLTAVKQNGMAVQFADEYLKVADYSRVLRLAFLQLLFLMKT